MIDPNECLLELSAPIDDGSIDDGSDGGMRTENYEDGTKYEGFKSDDLKEGYGTLYFATGLIAY